MENEGHRTLVAFWVGQETAKKLKDIARKADLTVSDLMRTVVLEIVKNYDNQPNKRFTPILFRLKAFESLCLEVTDRIKALMRELESFKGALNK